MGELAFDIGQELWLKNLPFGQGLGIGSSPTYLTLGSFVSNILPNIYVVAGLILFFLMIGGGLMFMVSGSQQNPEGAAKGKQAITAALIGFLIIFASYWIIEIIQVITGIEILKGGGL